MTPNGWKMSQGMPDRYTAYRLRAKFLAGNLLTPGLCEPPDRTISHIDSMCEIVFGSRCKSIHLQKMMCGTCAH